MNLFWIACAVLLLIALLIIGLPLWRHAGRSGEVQRDASNLEIFRDQIAELEADLGNGLLTQESYEQGKRELQARMLEEVKATEAAVASASSKKLIIALAILLPVFTVPIYLHLGNPDATRAQKSQIQPDSSGVIRSEAGIAALETQLKKQPENPDGWYMLANSYLAADRLMEASDAYGELVKLVPEEPQLWADYADIYGLAHGKTLQSKEVAGMLKQALDLDPENMKALALSGSAGMERGDFVTAIQYWSKLLDVPTLGAENAHRFAANVEEARSLLAQQPGGKEKLAQIDQQQKSTANPSQAVGAAVSGEVTLSKKLSGAVTPDDMVFVLARAAQGPKMPLAVFRKQVKDLPLKFTLDDSMAMRPELKMSGFDQVVVVARVSKSGSPMAQSGDLEGLSQAIKPGATGLKIVIDTIVE
ncbi:MAG: c-type cytochrome biogenesis protein CcmI [Pseudomonadota bacterium]